MSVLHHLKLNQLKQEYGARRGRIPRTSDIHVYEAKQRNAADYGKVVDTPAQFIDNLNILSVAIESPVACKPPLSPLPGSYLNVSSDVCILRR